MVGGGARQHRARARRAERGQPPRQDLLRPGRRQLVDGHGGSVLRHAARHPAAPLLRAPPKGHRDRGDAAAAPQDLGHLRRPGGPPRRR
ncbi:hypothetical protein ACQJBY_011668 [Aegilops geniculata]